MNLATPGREGAPLELVNERCGDTVNSFQFGRDDGPDGEARLTCIFDGLRAVNQDFREVTRMFSPDRVTIEVYAFEQGPFAGRDIRIKSKYTL
jgi:hypothetical protein